MREVEPSTTHKRGNTNLKYVKEQGRTDHTQHQIKAGQHLCCALRVMHITHRRNHVAQTTPGQSARLSSLISNSAQRTHQELYSSRGRPAHSSRGGPRTPCHNNLEHDQISVCTSGYVRWVGTEVGVDHAAAPGDGIGSWLASHRQWPCCCNGSGGAATSSGGPGWPM